MNCLCGSLVENTSGDSNIELKKIDKHDEKV